MKASNTSFQDVGQWNKEAEGEVKGWVTAPRAKQFGLRCQEYIGHPPLNTPKHNTVSALQPMVAHLIIYYQLSGKRMKEWENAGKKRKGVWMHVLTLMTLVHFINSEYQDCLKDYRLSKNLG